MESSLLTNDPHQANSRFHFLEGISFDNQVRVSMFAVLIIKPSGKILVPEQIVGIIILHRGSVK